MIMKKQRLLMLASLWALMGAGFLPSVAVGAESAESTESAESNETVDTSESQETADSTDATEEFTHEVIQRGTESVDDHHHGHSNKANFIPKEILNPDDSIYEGPEEAKELAGHYQGQVAIPGLDMEIAIVLSIEEDGIFNLAYYFINEPDQTGLRFYADPDGELHEVDAFYQDLVMMTGGLKEAEGGLGSGLIHKTISPVILLDQAGEPSLIYPYHNMAYELRENYSNARVYQNVGLYVVDDEVLIDVNHLIGYDSDEELVIALERDDSVAQSSQGLLVRDRTYEVLQDSFDNFLVDHNDFILEFEDANEFLQIIQALHLEANRSFPQETTFELIDPTLVHKPAVGDNTFALAINDSILYFYNGEKLFVAEDYEVQDGVYQAARWITN